jgi:two-component system alkaline phosphatase synthesis response regulator PhoP
MTENKKILIVDDEPDILKTVVYRIKKAGYETATALDGKEGLEKAKSENPDLIVLDWKLPIMDGGEVFTKLQADESLKNIPVIILTASSDNESLMLKLREIGAECVMIKPYEPEELLAKIKGLIG